MWEDRYKKANDQIHASEELKKKTIQAMMQQPIKKTSNIPLKVGLSFACCALLAVAIAQLKPQQSQEAMPESVSEPSEIALQNNLFEFVKVKAAVTKREMMNESQKEDQSTRVLINTQATHKIAAALSEEVFSNATENTLVSPLSVYFALSSAANLSDTETLNHYLAYLETDSMASLNQNVGHIKEQLSQQNNEYSQILFADSIWLDQSISYQTEGLQQLIDEWDVESYVADLSNPTIHQSIEQWIKSKTNGLVGEGFKLEPTNLVAFINTLYFKDQWNEPFHRKNTYPQEFYGIDQTIETEFMHDIRNTNLIETEQYQAIALHTSSRKAFWIVLPHEDVKLSSLTCQFDTVINELKNHEKETVELHLALPKFSFSTYVDLEKVLNKDETAFIFDRNADYSKLYDSLYVSGMSQNSWISIDENGLEVAAYTELGMEASAVEKKSRVVEMNVNRPFMVVLEDPSGLILFNGVVLLP